MDRLAAILEELANFRFWIERRDELDAALANSDQGNFDTFALEPFSAADDQSEHPFVGLDRPVEIANRDPNVVDPAEHAVDSKAGSFPTPLDKVWTLCSRVDHG